jgi:short-subunit dehydrogenase
LILTSRHREIPSSLAEFNSSDYKFRFFDTDNPQAIDSLVKDAPSARYTIISFIGYMTDNEKTLHDDQEALKTINTNYTNQVILFNHLLPLLRSNPGSSLFAVSSVAGDRGRASNFIYGSSKAGMSAYLSGLRMALAKENIHVGTIKPGFVYTKMTAHLKLPKPVTATPEDVAKAIYTAVLKKKNVTYVLGSWRLIMFIIKNIPEFIFKRLNF